MEVLSLRVEWSDAVDWGPVVDEWNEKNDRTMEELGALLKALLEPHHVRFAICY